jgi:hypothetical protein
MLYQIRRPRSIHPCIPHGVHALDGHSSEGKKNVLPGYCKAPDPLAHWPSLIAWYLYSSHISTILYLVCIPLNRNTHYSSIHTKYGNRCSARTVSHITFRHSALRRRNLDAQGYLVAVLRCQILMWKMWLTPLRFPKQMQLGRVQLPYRSPSANDTSVRTMKWTTFSNIRGNGVRLNGIAARGNEDLSSDSPQIHFSVPQDDATARIAYSAEQEVATALRVLGLCGGT